MTPWRRPQRSVGCWKMLCSMFVSTRWVPEKECSKVGTHNSIYRGDFFTSYPFVGFFKGIMANNPVVSLWICLVGDFLTDCTMGFTTMNFCHHLLENMFGSFFPSINHANPSNYVSFRIAIIVC